MGFEAPSLPKEKAARMPPLLWASSSSEDAEEQSRRQNILDALLRKVLRNTLAMPNVANVIEPPTEQVVFEAASVSQLRPAAKPLGAVAQPVANVKQKSRGEDPPYNSDSVPLTEDLSILLMSLLIRGHQWPRAY